MVDIPTASAPIIRKKRVSAPERQDLQKSQCFLGLLVASDVLYDHLGFAVLGDDQRLLVFVQVPYDFGGMGLQVTDWLDLAGQFHGRTSISWV